MRYPFLLALIVAACYYGCSTGVASTPIVESSTSTSFVSDSIRRYVSYPQSSIAVTNVTLFDGSGSIAAKDQTLLIEDGLITDVGPTNEIQIPTGATLISGLGKTLIPGFVGVHNHLHIPGHPDIGKIAAKLYLASGVTTIQTCGSASPYQELVLAKAIKEQLQVGPDIITSAPYITGPGGSRAMIIPRDQQHIRDTMMHWINQGVNWFKVYRHTRPEDLKTIIEVAHRNDAKVTGHLCSITFEEAVNMGIDGIEHGLNAAADFRTDKEYGVCNGGRSYMDSLDLNSDKVIELLQLMVDKNTFLNSTLSIYESGIPERSIADERSLKAMSPALVARYQERRKSNENSTSPIDKVRRLKRIMAFEYTFFQMGGLLGAGVDPGRHNMPGYGDQRNYELFIEAGYRPGEAIQILTSNGSEILNRKDIGTLEAGKRADFLLLDGDLQSDASTIREIDVVFKQGIGYAPDQIIAETHGKVGL